MGNVFEIACPECEVAAFRPGQYRPCCPAEVSREGNEAEDRDCGNGTSSGGVKGGKVIRLRVPNPAGSPCFGATSEKWVKFSRVAAVERKWCYLVCSGRYAAGNISGRANGVAAVLI